MRHGHTSLSFPFFVAKVSLVGLMLAFVLLSSVVVGTIAFAEQAQAQGVGDTCDRPTHCDPELTCKGGLCTDPNQPTAQTGSGTTGNEEDDQQGTGTTRNEFSIQIRNPLGDTDSFQEVLSRIINLLLFFGIPLVVLAIVIAGLMFIAGGANPERRQTAINIIKYAIIGLVVMLLARALVSAIQTLI